MTTSSATVIAAPSMIAEPSGRRATAIHTAAPTARPVAPCGCSAASATPAAPIAAITAACNPRPRSMNRSRIATASEAAKTTSASVTAEPVPCTPGAG